MNPTPPTPLWLLPDSPAGPSRLPLPLSPSHTHTHTHTHTHPSPSYPLPPTPPPGLAPEHIDSAVYLITAHNLFISPPPKRAAAVTQHTTRGLEEGYWDTGAGNPWWGWGLKLKGKTAGLMAATITITPQRASGWTCFAQIPKKKKKKKKKI